MSSDRFIIRCRWSVSMRKEGTGMPLPLNWRRFYLGQLLTQGQGAYILVEGWRSPPYARMVSRYTALEPRRSSWSRSSACTSADSRLWSRVFTVAPELVWVAFSFRSEPNKRPVRMPRRGQCSTQTRRIQQTMTAVVRVER